MSMTEQRRVDALASWSYVDSRPAGVEGEDLLNLSVTDSKPKSVRCVCVWLWAAIVVCVYDRTRYNGDI